MLARIFVHPLKEERISALTNLLFKEGLKNPHPDVLFLDEEKLGVEDAKKIRNFLTLKPFQADKRAVILVNAHKLTNDAQNSLLKTLEEPPDKALIGLGAETENAFLPTILSRCQIEFLDKKSFNIDEKYLEKAKVISKLSLEEKFKYIEKLEEKDQFLKALLIVFREKLHKDKTLINFVKELQEAEKWSAHNVNMRAILEYLMLKIP